jgi:hypothetical protein
VLECNTLLIANVAKKVNSSHVSKCRVFCSDSFHHYIYRVWRRAIKKKEIKEEDDHVIQYKCKFAIDNYVYE